MNRLTGQRVTRLFFLVVALIAYDFGEATTVRAAAVTLTSGNITIDCSGLAADTSGSVDLAGQDFLMRFGFGGPPRPVCSPSPVNVIMSTITPRFDEDHGFAIYKGAGPSYII